MRTYIIRRLLLVIPTVFLVSIIIFFVIRFIPGDVIEVMVGTMEYQDPIDVETMRNVLGLDAPIITQYGRWMGNIILHGDFGNSLWSGLPTTHEIIERWPITLELGIMALIVGQLIALPIGIFSALRQDTWGDYIARSFAIMCIAVPGFWLGTMVIVFPSIWWGYMPPVTFIPFTENPLDNLRMFIVPAIVMGMALSGTTMRMTRTMMLEVLKQDYIRTAWAKGLRERTVVIRHALKNALIPVITIVGLQIPVLIGGTIIIEQIFCLPGMGRLLMEAIGLRDYPVVSTVMLFFGVIMVLVNLAVDLTYGFLDPRVKYR
ncbi:ABC transporter permease [Chloroflexota bacterium]